jgi:methyl-accepting chemotaxis protein
MLSRLSIRAKIAAAVSLLLVSLAAMGLVAILKMRAINADAMEIAASRLPSVRELGALRAGVIDYRNNLREHLLAETLEEKQAAERSLEGVDASNDRIRKTYESMISSPAERTLYDQWSRAWAAYKEDAAKVMELSRQAVGRVPHEAHELGLKAGKQALMDADSILEKDIELNNKAATADTESAAAAYDTAFWQVVAILCASVAFGLGVGLYIVRDVANGIASIVEPMQAIGQGDLSAPIPHCGERTEIGLMADALQVFKDALIAKKAAEESSAKDAAEIERGRRVEDVTRNFERMIGEIVQTIASASSQLEASAGALSGTAARSQQLSTSVVAASEQASANVKSVASAAEEMAMSVTEIGRQVQESARMATHAVGQARSTTERVSELSKAAGRIGDVVELINTVAGQTNLLALNATIEAARAGEAGRGFAVVASEVKALAEQTAKATGEISQQIGAIQAATQDSVGAIKDISGTIEKLSEISSTIATAVEQQGVTTKEISRNVQQAAMGAQQVSSGIADVQCGATETGSASSQVLAAAKTLSGDSGRLKDEVARFLTSVHAA